MQEKSGQWAVGSRQWGECGERPQAPGIRLRETQSSSLPTAHRPLRTRPAFTLTELLIVIAIIAVLAGLITAAAVNAMRGSQRSSITLDIKNISGAIENFKNDYGAYPPNAMNPNPPTAYPAITNRVRSDFQRMFKKAFQRSNEPDWLIAAICGANNSASVPNLQSGMRASEAVVFWLGGFSDDPQYPITGPGGPSFATNDPTNPNKIENLENRNWRYQFEITQLGPRDGNGAFDVSTNRFIDYEIDLNGNGNTNDVGEKRRINFWQYVPGSSEQPLVYFDCSRYKPEQYDMWAAETVKVFALKQPRSGVTNPTVIQDVVFVDQGKFQILHCGLDDAWGEKFSMMGITPWGSAQNVDATQPNPLLLYPSGPFIGEIGDTLTSFTEGTIADAAEE